MANALYWLLDFHIDGLRVDAVASMLYLDYSRPADGWTPNAYGGRENLEAVQFLQEMNATVHKLAPGIATIAEESTSWPGSPCHQPWRTGLFDEVEHGVDARHPRLLRPRPHLPSLSPPRDDVLHAVCLQREFRSPDQPRRSGAWQGHAMEPYAGQRPRQGRWAAQPAGLPVGAPGKKLLFMGQDFGQRAEWSEYRGLDWFQLDENGFSGGILRFVADMNAVYRSRPALWSLDSNPKGYSWIDANDSASNVLSFLRMGPTGR